MKKEICIAVCALLLMTVFVIETPKNTNAEVIVKEEWVARYTGSGDGNNYAIGMAIDKSGNVYVTGTSYNNETYCDYATIAYDSNGNELWVARYNGPGNYIDHAEAIALDSFGNIYVTGGSHSNHEDRDFTTIAYDSKGNQLWVARYNDSGNHFGGGRAITVNSFGYIFVTGPSAVHGEDQDFATLAYDSNGNELWVARYGPKGNYGDWPHDIAVDSSGNVYVTGITTWGMQIQRIKQGYATVAYDSSGNELWVARYNGPSDNNSPSSITVDSSGNIYVTGRSLSEYSSTGGTGFDYATVAYDSSGNELWVARYNGPGDGDDGAGSIITDSKGNVYVTGGSFSGYPYQGGTWGDYATIAYDSLGNELWVTRYNGPWNESDGACAMAVDQFGTIYVTGGSFSAYPYYGGTWDDYATLAYNQAGNELWVKRYNGPVNGSDYSRDIAVDQIGNVYVTGCSKGDNGLSNYCTIKYSQQELLSDATIDLDPNTLNLKSKGKWITAYITLPENYDVNNIDFSTIMLEDSISAEWGDVQGNILMVKFDRSEVEDLIGLAQEKVELTVTGKLTNGIEFEGSDIIRTIKPP